MARGPLSSSDAASDASCPEKWWSGAVQAGQHTGQLEEAAIFVAPVVTVSALQYAQPVANEQQHASWRAWMGTFFFQRSLPRGTQSESVYDHLEKRACRFLCR